MRETMHSESVKIRFLQFCKNLKISQIEISKKFDISRNSVNRWFNLKYKAMPPLMVALYLSEKYGLTLELLVDDKNTQRQKNDRG